MFDFHSPSLVDRSFVLIAEAMWSNNYFLHSLPGPESLLEPGRREGQTKLVRQGASVMCYSWSSSASQWSKVGDVMGAAGGTEATKTLHQGKEYDFVFSIDIEEGQVALKLPYNRDQDPWLVAQNFIHEHDLSQYYLETVANFIINNSGGEIPKNPFVSYRKIPPINFHCFMTKLQILRPQL